MKSKELKSVNSNLECDTLVIGGGMSGLSILYQLKKANIKTILVERNRCGQGVSARSSAKITYLQGSIYQNIRRFGNIKLAKQYLNSQIAAIAELKRIVKKEHIDCDFAVATSYLFTDYEKNKDKLQQEYEFLKSAGAKVQFLENTELFKYAIASDDTYMFNPVKYMLGLKDILKDSIYENSKVKKIVKLKSHYEVAVNGFVIKAKHVVIATHYPYFLLPMLLPFKSHVETSFVGAARVDEYKNINAINIDKEIISFRYYKTGENNYFIYLLGSTPSCNIKSIKENFAYFKENKNFVYEWSNKDIITNDYLPIIGKIDDEDDGALIACGYNTWGMSNSTIAGVIIKDIICKKENEYIESFRPNRLLNLNKVVRFIPDMIGNVKAFVKSNKNNCNNKKVCYTKYEGKRVAIYKDEKGLEHMVLNRCPHLKCGLVFNEVEKTWDCLCHGSRFDIDGKCIEGPSNYDISIKRKSDSDAQE